MSGQKNSFDWMVIALIGGEATISVSRKRSERSGFRQIQNTSLDLCARRGENSGHRGLNPPSLIVVASIK